MFVKLSIIFYIGMRCRELGGLLPDLTNQSIRTRGVFNSQPTIPYSVREAIDYLLNVREEE